MSKELDYLDDILNYGFLTLGTKTIIESIKEKIQRLETIDNANPSEFKIVNYKGQYYLQINVNDDEATQVQLPLLEDEIKDVQLAIDKFNQIKRTKPSEALKIVNNILDNFGGEKVQIETMTLSKCNILTIKQALLKSQEQEKVLKIIFEKGLSLVERDMIKQSENYEQYQIKISWWNYKPFAIPKSQEEFELLKRYCDEEK